jgi:WD40 repeat protein
MPLLRSERCMLPKVQCSCAVAILRLSVDSGYSELFATCGGSDIRVWNSRNCVELLRIQVPNVEVHCVAFTMDGTQILSGWSDGKVRAFGPQSGKLLFVINDAHVGG